MTMLSFLALAIVAPSGVIADRFSGLGPHHRHLSTRSRDAEAFFNQGLELMYGFNKDEAVRSFTEATRLDPKCAVAYWGIATASGPDINNPAVDPDHAKAAWDALVKARSLSVGA